MYHELIHDAKALKLDDKAFRVLIDALCFASRAPALLQRRGWLYHHEGLPVGLDDFVRALPVKPENTPERIQKALDDLCALGGPKHSFLVWDGKRKAWRVRNWRKWQDGFVTEFCQNFATEQPGNGQEKTAIDVRRKTKGGGAEKDPAPCPFCAYAAKHHGEPVPDGKRFRNQRFHDCAVSVLGCCYKVTPRAQKAWKDAAEEFGEEQALGLWRSFLVQPSTNGHPIAFFQARFQEYREQQARRDQPIEHTRPG